MRQSGFSVLEFLIYFFASTLLVMILMTWVAQLHMRMIVQEKDCSGYMSLCAAYDCLLREVRQAPGSTAWLHCEPNAYIWPLREHAVGWEITKKGALVRSQGTYCSTTNVWTQRTKNTIAQGCQRLTIDCDGIRAKVTLGARTGNQERVLSNSVYLMSML